MHGGETAETAEICHIQREYMAYTVHAHGGSQSGIVHLNTQHTVLYDDNPAPLSLNLSALKGEDSQYPYGQTHG
jgi:hypothetical protein